MPLRLLAAFLLTFTLAACGEDAASLPEGPPAGFEHEGGHYWRTGVDTAEVFRDLSSLAAMGVAVPETGVDNILRGMVKRRVIELYRNNPELVDSLFGEVVVPALEDVSISGSVNEAADAFEDEAVRLLRRQFRAPGSPQPSLQEQPPVFPETTEGGRVEMQVYLDAEGVPQAIEVLETAGPEVTHAGVHAVAGRQWQGPAYVLRDGAFVAVPSFVRYALTFPPTE